MAIAVATSYLSCNVVNCLHVSLLFLLLSLSHQWNLPTSSTSATTLKGDEYNGIPLVLIRPIFASARRLRFSRPTVTHIVNDINSRLDHGIVSAILEGALHPEDTPDSHAIRREEMALKATHTLEAETKFVNKIRKIQLDIEDDAENGEWIKIAIDQGSNNVIRLTPDISFASLATIRGYTCYRIEYKNTFGLKFNPFLHAMHKKQLRQHIATFGLGMVVYKMGYECGLLKCRYVGTGSKT